MASGLNVNDGGSVSLTRHTTVRAIRRMRARHGKNRAAVVTACTIAGSPTMRKPMMNSTGPIAAASDMGAPASTGIYRRCSASTMLANRSETRHTPAAQHVQVLENDSAEFAG